MKITLLLALFFMAHRDRPHWFNLSDRLEPRLEDAAKIKEGISELHELRGHVDCQLPKQVLKGPNPLETELEWHGHCPEHFGGHALEPVGYHGRQFPLQDFQNRWNSLQSRMGKGYGLTPKERTEAASLGLALSLYHLNHHKSNEHQLQEQGLRKPSIRYGSDNPATAYVTFLCREATQWPLALSNQWPVLEWIILEYWCQRGAAEGGHVALAASGEILNFLRENRPLLDSESSIFWPLILAHQRHVWALTFHRPMDALAYYRESSFHHQTWLASLWKLDEGTRTNAMNAGGEFRNFWFGIAILGLLSMVMWGWLDQRRVKTVEYSVPAPLVTMQPIAISEYERPQSEEHTLAGESVTPLYSDITRLWNFKLHTHQQWEDFKSEYNRCIPGFLPSLRLEFPGLTQSDIRLACLIRLGMTSNEISKIQNISVQGVAMARYRLRKRLNLGPEESILDKLNAIG